MTGRRCEPRSAVKIALTGATGFVGSHLLRRLQDEGHDLRALTRRKMRALDRVEWIDGDLANRDSLAELVAGCDSVIHVAGVLNAATAAGFTAGNVSGTGNLLDVAAQAGCGRFVHVSSLAAREPSLSLYGASKAQAEDRVRHSPMSFAVVRPPAVYGPGDRETLELFRMAQRRILFMPPTGRLSLIHVDDLARLLAALADPDGPANLTIEPDDGRPGGYDHREFGRLLGLAVRRHVLTVNSPRLLLSLGARLDRLVRGKEAKLTRDRVAYFCHPDWVCDPALAAPPELWRPAIEAAGGLAATAHWYRAEHWL